MVEPGKTVTTDVDSLLIMMIRPIFRMILYIFNTCSYFSVVSLASIASFWFSVVKISRKKQKVNWIWHFLFPKKAWDLNIAKEVDRWVLTQLRIHSQSSGQLSWSETYLIYRVTWQKQSTVTRQQKGLGKYKPSCLLKWSFWVVLGPPEILLGKSLSLWSPSSSSACICGDGKMAIGPADLLTNHWALLRGDQEWLSGSHSLLIPVNFWDG